MTCHIIVMTSHGVSVSYHSILDQGQALCISKILSYQPQHPTTHILNHVHQHKACNRTHTLLHIAHLIEITCVGDLRIVHDTVWKHPSSEACARAHTGHTRGAYGTRTHKDIDILHATCIPIPLARADLRPSLNFIWKSNESTYFTEVRGVRVRAGESFAPLGGFYQTHLREHRSAQGGRCDAFDLCIPASCN